MSSFCAQRLSNVENILVVLYRHDPPDQNKEMQVWQNHKPENHIIRMSPARTPTTSGRYPPLILHNLTLCGPVTTYGIDFGRRWLV